MATDTSPQPVDVAQVYLDVTNIYRSPATGLLPTQLAKIGSGTLDQLARERLTQQGIQHFSATDYGDALRLVIDELAHPDQVHPGRVRIGQAVADRADELLEASGEKGYKAYAAAIEDASRIVELEERRDVLTAVKARLR